MDAKYSLGRRIAYLRQKRGWSQEQLGFESGINRNYISDIEKGRRNPTLMMLVRLATAFELDLAALLKGVDIE